MAACVVILICGSVLAVNPSLAANLPILGTIFQKVEKGVIYSGEYKDAKKITQEKENHLSAQSQGIKTDGVGSLLRWIFCVCYDENAGMSRWIFQRKEMESV